MKATKIEFRLRVWIITALYIFGFVAPWQYIGASPHAPRMWSWLALQLFSTRALTSQQAFVAVLVASIALAVAGAILRLAGTAHLGIETVEAANPQARRIVAAGPYRYIRNPLYLGTWLTGIAVSLLMPFTGAFVFIVALAVFELRLVAAEESNFTTHLGEAYLLYRSKTGRLLPRLRRPPAAPHETNSTRWLRALAAEIFPLAVALILATLGWTYDAPLLTRAIIIAFGASLVARALLPPARSQADSTASR